MIHVKVSSKVALAVLALAGTALAGCGSTQSQGTYRPAPKYSSTQPPTSSGAPAPYSAPAAPPAGTACGKGKCG